MHLLDAVKHFLVELAAKQRLGVGVVLVLVLVSTDGDSCTLRGRARQFEQLDAPVHGGGLRHRPQVHALGEIERKSEVRVVVARGRQIGVFWSQPEGRRLSCWHVAGRKLPPCECGSHSAEPDHNQYRPQIHFSPPSYIVSLTAAGVNAHVRYNQRVAFGADPVQGWAQTVCRETVSERNSHAALHALGGASRVSPLPAVALPRHNLQGTVSRQRLRPCPPDSLFCLDGGFGLLRDASLSTGVPVLQA